VFMIELALVCGLDQLNTIEIVTHTKLYCLFRHWPLFRPALGCPSIFIDYWQFGLLRVGKLCANVGITLAQ
jgi:hypothetical protein